MALELDADDSWWLFLQSVEVGVETVLKPWLPFVGRVCHMLVHSRCRPLPHFRTRPHWKPPGNPEYARNTLRFPKDEDSCRMGRLSLYLWTDLLIWHIPVCDKIHVLPKLCPCSLLLWPAGFWLPDSLISPYFQLLFLTILYAFALLSLIACSFFLPLICSPIVLLTYPLTLSHVLTYCVSIFHIMSNMLLFSFACNKTSLIKFKTNVFCNITACTFEHLGHRCVAIVFRKLLQ